MPLPGATAWAAPPLLPPRGRGRLVVGARRAGHPLRAPAAVSAVAAAPVRMAAGTADGAPALPPSPPVPAMSAPPVAAEASVTELLSLLPSLNGGVSPSRRSAIDRLLETLPASHTPADSVVGDPRLAGAYDVAYVSAGDGGTPAGGRLRSGLGRALFPTTALVQALTPAGVVINIVRFRLLGLLPGLLLLVGTLRPATAADLPAPSNRSSSAAARSILPQGAVHVAFERPRLALGVPPLRAVVSLGRRSTVVLGTPYLDDRIRVGRGGRGSWFVFTRRPGVNPAVVEGWPAIASAPAVPGWAFAVVAVGVVAGVAALAPAWVAGGVAVVVAALATVLRGGGTLRPPQGEARASTVTPQLM
ncbi:hypothetical protein MMPV_002858 [Pyropia vietnamensis]